MELTQSQYNELKNRGLTDDDIKSISSKKGYTVPNTSIVADFSKGVAKGLVGDVVRPLAQGLQYVGQKTMSLAPGISYDNVRAKTGFEDLKDETAAGQNQISALQTDTSAEVVGRVAANIASFFIPASPVALGTGKVLGTTGKIITKVGVATTAKEAPLLQAYKARYSVAERIASALGIKTILNKPVTNADTVVRNKLFGTESMIGVKAKKAAGNIWNKVIGPALKSSKEKVNIKFFIKELQEQVENIPELSRRNEMRNALMSLADDYKKIGDVSLETLQKYKEGWAKYLPDKVYKGKPVAGAFRDVQNMAASLARNKIYKAIPDIEIRAAYLDYGNLKNLQEIGQKAMTGAKFKGGAGGFLHGVYDMLITPIATTGGLTLYKTGEGLEFIGKQGVGLLGHIFK